MAPLNCPLCCNETFASHTSLKYHILGMLDNLLCPSCNERCEDLMDLADHLGRECVNFEDSNNFEPEKNGNEIHEGGTMDTSCEGPDVTRIKQEMEEVATEGQDSSKDDAPVNEQVDHNDIQDDPNMIYTCEMCDMTFHSVQDHLAKYHEGEEVVLETEHEEAITEAQDEEDGPFSYNGNTDDDMFDEGSIVDESIEDPSERAENANEAVLEDNNASNATHEGSSEPITTKYIVEDGKVRKITEEEAINISDQSRIIEIHSCPNCNLQFPNLSHFKKHSCNNARKVISKRSEKSEKKSQLLKIKEEFRYQCTFCLAVYSSLIALNDHMKSHLVQDDTGLVQKKTITMTLHICHICNTKFPTYKQLRLHSRMHEPVKAKQVDPPVSYNIMGEPNEEKTHLENSEREQFECSICGKFYDKEYEEVHMKFHEEQRQFICLVCNRKFDNKDNLDLHKKAHSSAKKFACSYCKKTFNNYAALENHVLNQCQQRDFECQYCGRRFGRPHEKVKHERIHTGEKPHVCELCGKAFRVGYCLTLHMRTHTGNRPYTCQYCGKRFKSHSVYNHHKKTHSESRNYKCSFCPKAFKTAVQLAGHRNSHTKPFTCTECNRPFASLYAVRAHMETHKRKNNLKYECWMCGANYARAFALKDHMNEVHGQNTIIENSQDEQALIELQGVTDEAQMENPDQQNATGEQPGEIPEHQMEGEDEEYQVTGAEAEMCQVQVLGDGNEEQAYVVHLQDVGGSETIEENNMEVIET